MPKHTSTKPGPRSGAKKKAPAVPKASPPATPGRASPKSRKPLDRAPAKPILLAGGNPQIAKAYGDAPVRAYIAAMPGWKRTVGRRLDAIIARTVPRSAGLHKAVKWNSPLYGADGSDRDAWFLGMHCFAGYIKVAFFRGASLNPMPPGPSKQKEVRYLDIREHEELDESRFAEWVRQASRLPGVRM